MCFMTSTKKHNKDASPFHNSRHSATFTATKNFIDFVFQTMGIALLSFSQPRDLAKLSTMNRHINCLVRKDVAKLCISRCPFTWAKIRETESTSRMGLTASTIRSWRMGLPVNSLALEFVDGQSIGMKVGYKRDAFKGSRTATISFAMNFLAAYFVH